MTRRIVMTFVWAASLLAGCATPPDRVDTASLTDCREIGSEVARIKQQRVAAEAKKDGAWKQVIPFVVVGQYIEGKQDVETADRRLSTLDDQAARQGCSS